MTSVCNQLSGNAKASHALGKVVVLNQFITNSNSVNDVCLRSCRVIEGFVLDNNTF